MVNFNALTDCLAIDDLAGFIEGLNHHILDNASTS
jgi:hypothetical protein